MAKQQIQAMGQEMEQMHQMITNVGKSIEAQDMERKNFEAQVKAYSAETQRISAIQASMSPEQIQDIVMGTVHGMITSGDLIGEMPSRSQNEPMLEQDQYQQPQQMQTPEQGMMPPEGMQQ
jgi:hypothetical protein